MDILTSSANGSGPAGPYTAAAATGTAGSCSSGGGASDGVTPPAVPAESEGELILWQAILIHKSCMPFGRFSAYIANLSRPTQLPPGAQSTRLLQPEDPTSCGRNSNTGDATNNGSSSTGDGVDVVPMVSRCFQTRYMMADVGLYATELDAYGRTRCSGYVAWLVGCQSLCESLVTEQCIAENGGLLGCYNRRFRVWPAGNPPGAFTGGSGAPGSGGGEEVQEAHSALLVPVLVGLLVGGAVLTAVIIGAVVLYRRMGSRGWPQCPLERRRAAAAAAAAAAGAAAAGAAETAAERHETRSDEQCRYTPGPGAGAAETNSRSCRVNWYWCWYWCWGGGGRDLGALSSADDIFDCSARLRGKARLELELGPEAAPAGAQGADPGGAVAAVGGAAAAAAPSGRSCGAATCSSGSCHSHEGGGTTSDTGASAVLTHAEAHGGPTPQSAAAPLRCLAPEVALTPVTPVTPLRPGVRLEGAAMEAQVKLLPVTLGKGSFGRVVEGMYGGERVAVKLLNQGLLSGLPGAPGEAAPPAAVAAEMAAAAPPKARPLAAAAAAGALVPGHEGFRALLGSGPEVVTMTGTQLSFDDRGTVGEGVGAAAGLQHQHWRGEATGEGVDDAAAGGSGGGGAALRIPEEPPLSRGRLAIRALKQEVEVLARCQHPNIVRLLAASLEPPRVCLVMELMDTSLDRLLHGPTRRNLPLGTVLHIGIQVARALAFLHPTILHRDLKPANVLISQPHSDTPLAKLADFGLSRLRDTVLVTRDPEVGTVPYMAPEVFDLANQTVTDRADIYALGVILWEMLTGQRPWAGYGSVQVAYTLAVLHKRLPLHDLPYERCPPKLWAIIGSCWESDPARRPAAAEVVKNLVLVQAQQDRVLPP